MQEQGGSLLWQKEALLNLALKHIPGHIQYIAWIDCDVLFEDDHWITEEILSQVKINILINRL